MNQQQKVARLKQEGRGPSPSDNTPDNGRNGNPASVSPSVSEAAASQVQVTVPDPPATAEVSWEQLSQIALIGIGFVVAIAALYFARSILMPVLAATIIGITLSPIQKHAEKYRIPPIFTAAALVLAFCGGLWLAVTLVAGPLTDWVARAPELSGMLKEKMQLLDRPLAMLRDLQNALTGAAGGSKPTVAVETSPTQIAQQALIIITPALTELVIFFGTLLFLLVGINRMRRQLIVFFPTRDARLTVVRIWNDIEQNLITYLATVTAINVGLGAVTAGLLYVLGFPNPVAFGILISVLNYVPYIGAAIFVAMLFVVGLDRHADDWGRDACARAVRHHRDRRGPAHYAGDRRAPPDDEPVPGVSCAGVLGVAMGTARRVPCHPVPHCQPGGDRSSLSARRKQCAARLAAHSSTRAARRPCA